MSYNKKLYDVLENIEKKYYELQNELEAQTNDFSLIKKLNKIIRNNEKIINKFKQYKDNIAILENADNLIKNETDLAMIDFIKQECEEAKINIDQLEQEIKILLLPKDENDDKNVIIEMRPAAGGDESSIFVGNLFDAYQRYSISKGWTIEIIESSFATHGYSFISFSISGDNVYSRMKFESGVHRVQRVPATESKGRVHTSTITVAVLPEVEEVDIEINKSDLREDTFRASGSGGQHVNRTESAVRITHLPTNIAVACQEGKSQHANRETAMKMLRAKLYELKMKQQHDEMSSLRKNQVGSGERSEKIRTYNYPQNRVTDHRINLTLNKLDQIMIGQFDEIIDSLIANEQAEKMQNFKI